MKKRWDSLDALRGIFIIFIVLYHVNGTFHQPFNNVFSLIYCYGGYFGNYFFFFLSGFLIAHSYKREICENGMSLKAFLSKRMLKLYPLYFITNVICFAGGIRQSGWMGYDLKTIILNLFMMTSGWIDDVYPYNSPCWFVSVLLLCYVLYWGVCAKTRKNNEIYVLMILGLIFLGYTCEQYSLNIPFMYVHNGEGYLNFFAGCLWYEVYTLFIRKKKNIILLCAGGGYPIGYTSGDIRRRI